MSNLNKKAAELFQEGFSCSEAIVHAAYECKIIDQNLNPEYLNQIVSAFSGGMGESGCLCGAVAGAQMVLGSVFGRKDTKTPPKNMKAISKSFVDKFKEKRKATCCRVLTAGYDFHSPERRQNCATIVADVAELLENHIKENISQETSAL